MSSPTGPQSVQEPRQPGGMAPPVAAQTAARDSLDGLMTLQRAVGNQAIGRMLRAGPPGNGGNGGNGDGKEEGSFGNGSNGVRLQRKAANDQQSDQAEKSADEASEMAVAARKPEMPTRSFITEDDAEQLAPGQMKKSDFLALLYSSVCTATEESLAGTMWSSMGCPFIDRWFANYSGKSAQYIERALIKYAPEVASAGSAREYITVVTARLRQGIGRWRETGEVTGVPEELAQGGMPGATAAGLLGGLVSGALTAIGGAVSAAVSSAGHALAGIGGALFKAREGGPSEVEDPAAIHSQLGSGHSMDGGSRGRMESAFGADFSSVKIHTDTTAHDLSDDFNAKAFTIGSDIAFARGEYQPGTLVGDALIAHELAHVVQQGNAGGSVAAAQTKSNASYGALEEEADLAAAGAVISVWGDGATKALAPKAGVPRLRSGLQLQGCSSNKTAVKSATKEMTQAEKDHARFRSEKLAARDKNLEEAGTELREVGQWVRSAKMRQSAREITNVEDLDDKQRAKALDAAKKMKGLSELYDTTGLEAVRSKLQEAVTKSKGPTGMRTEEQAYSETRMAPIRGREALDEAVSALEKLRDSVDGYRFWQEIEQARALLDSDDKAEFAKQIKIIREEMFKLQNDKASFPGAISRIQFVVQYFVAMNSPDFAGLPSVDEVKKFRGKLTGSLGADFTLVFGAQGPGSPFEFFEAYADVLDKQLVVLDKMSTAGKPAKTPLPTQGEVEAFFGTLKTRKNDEVRDLYTQYAGGYFYHRGVANFDDMNEKNVADLYTRKLSIAGTRPLVCTGYAILGADLFTKAGGKVDRFINAVRATDDDVKNNRIDEGHALAQITRTGQTFFVSNDLTVDTEKGGIGPDAVAWDKKDAPLFKAAGSTQPASLAALIAALKKKMDALNAPKGGKKK